jgi:hypothetical protein
MSLLPFPADSTEYEEFTSVMNAMADEAEASTPDPEPVHSDARSRYTDAELYPESQYGGDGPWNNYGGDGPDEESDELRAREDADYYVAMHEREDEPEDRYLDSSWEDTNEYGMDGCCGDF